MDAKSLPLCPDSPLARLLLEAPVLPYAVAAALGTWLGLHGRPGPMDASWPWLLATLALAALGRPRLRPLAAVVLVAALGLGAGTAGRSPDLSALSADSPVIVEGRVASHLRGAPGEEWLWLRVESLEWGGGRIEGSFEVLLGLPSGPRPTELSADMDDPAWGQRVRLKGFLKRSPVLGNGTEPRPGPWRFDLASWRFWQVTAPASGWQPAATAVRNWVDGRLESSSRSFGGRLRRALLMGNPDRLSEEARRTFRAHGLSHLLAVSGLHVGLVAGWLWLLAMPLGRRTRLLVSLLGMACYLLLVGPRASAVRAAGMGGLVALALCCRRPPQALNAVSLWAALLALRQPQILDDLGFRLSVAATMGILVLAPTLSGALCRATARCGWLAAGLGVSLAAQLSTLPLLTPWTALVHPAAPWINLLAVPWLTVFLGLALLSLPFPWLDPWLVPLLDLLALPFTWLMRAPPSCWTTLPVSWSVLESLAVAALVAAAVLWPRIMLRLALLAAVLCLPGGVPLSRQTVAEPEGALEFIRLDVGQGDALLLRDGSHAVLVDGGGWRRGDLAARVVLPALARLGVRRLDAVVLTHPDTDHCQGLVDLSSYLQIGEVWASAGWHQDCAGELLARAGPHWRPLWRGDQGSVGRWHLEVLWPPPGLRGSKANARSLVLRATGGRQRVLLLGDIEAATERRLVGLEGKALGATILGVAHHGSKTSTTDAFLDAVAPQLATVGVGARNSYGHPHPTVLARLEANGIRVHRTDTMGFLHLRLDPQGEIQRRGTGTRKSEELRVQ